ncbi:MULTISPECIES: DUF7668 domain-containing protein [Acidithiobacillus]|uniref:DUF7668 domain-containing protein n=1 Tax=Acidithiobacillus sulfurivorans TaxID=1958756 RepID=UPI003F61F5BA
MSAGDAPVDGWSLSDVYLVRKQKTVFDMDVPLWTVEESRSDLMLRYWIYGLLNGVFLCASPTLPTSTWSSIIPSH